MEPARATAARRGVAAFDFDGTLVPGDSLLPYLRRLVGWRHLAAVPTRHGFSLLRAYHSGGRDQVKALLLAQVLPGVSLERAEALGERIGVELLRRVRPDMAQAVAWHRSQGHRLILVSASLAIYLTPFARASGFELVIATRLRSGADGRLTGELDGANVRGPEKARLLSAALGDGPRELWAYGDSAGDRQMLAIADHPHLIRRRSPRELLGRRREGGTLAASDPPD